jgi:hypothetical protein
MNIRIATAIAIILGVMIYTGGCKKQAEGEKGFVTFLVGKAAVIKNGANSAPLALNDAVAAGDVVTTGEKSVVALQFSSDCVVRLEENASMRITDLKERDRTLHLGNGAVLAKLARTQGNAMTVTTRTSVAAVRGTRFSVTSGERGTTVAVTEGSVAVKAASHDDRGVSTAPAGEEKLADAGRAVEVDVKKAEAKPSLTMRQATESEKKEIQKVDIVPVVQKPGRSSLQELRDMEKTILEKEKSFRTEGTGGSAGKIKDLLSKKNRSMNDIKATFDRIDEITLYNGRVIQGAIMSRGANYVIITPGGTVSVPEAEIKNVQIIR